MTQETSTLGLYLAHRGALVDYAQGMTGSRASAEDVVQEAWLRFDAVTRGRLLEEPLGYLYRIVRNLSLDSRRRASHEDVCAAADAALLADAIAGEVPSPEAEALHRAELRTLARAMAELPERTRVALEMHRFGGCKLREIAEHLGISVTHTHTLLTDGLEHCKRRLRR